MINYMIVLSVSFPLVLAYNSGSVYSYSDIVWEGGDPLPLENELSSLWRQVSIELKCIDIKAERDRRKESGILVGDKWFHSDNGSRIQQLGLFLFGDSVPDNLMWKTMDGSFVLMTPVLAKDIFVATAASDQLLFTIAEQKKQEMITTSDPNLYQSNINWPTTYDNL